MCVFSFISIYTDSKRAYIHSHSHNQKFRIIWTFLIQIHTYQQTAFNNKGRYLDICVHNITHTYLQKEGYKKKTKKKNKKHSIVALYIWK